MPSVQQECLDHFLILGERHFNHLVVSWKYYHTVRPHVAKENELLVLQHTRPTTVKESAKASQPPMLALPALRDVHCREGLGELLKHEYRKSA